jgi:prophage tail gpP-like protein
VKPGVISLSIDGHDWTGWKDVEISTGIDTLTGSFSLSTAARADGKDADYQFKAGSPASVAIDGQTIITGWIDRVDPGYDAQSHGIALSGRDRSCDLADCSAIHSPGSWRGARIETIAAELAKPFGIKVSVKASTGAPIGRFAVQQGESVHDAIERLLRYRGLLMVTTATGDVEIITPATGAPEFAIDLARVLSGGASHDATERFSDYILKGQGSGDDATHGKAASGPSAKAKDPAVMRYRPIIIIGEEQSNAASLDKRAKWEAVTRAAKAQRLTYNVQGFYAQSGQLWHPNRLISVRDDRLFADSPMLIERVTFKKGDAGSTTELALVPPEAWSQMAVPEEREAGRVKKGKKP